MSVTGPASSMPARSASMSYLMFWPTFSIAGFVRAGRRAARVAAGRAGATGRPAQRQVITSPDSQQNDSPTSSAQRIDRGRLGVDAEPGLPLQLVEEIAQCLGRVHDGVMSLPAGLLGGLVVRQLVAKPVKAALGAERFEGLDIGTDRLECLPVEVEKQVVAQRDEAAA